MIDVVMVMIVLYKGAYLFFLCMFLCTEELFWTDVVHNLQKFECGNFLK